MKLRCCSKGDEWVLTAQHQQTLIKHFDTFDDRLTVIKFHQIPKAHSKLSKDISSSEIRGIHGTQRNDEFFNMQILWIYLGKWV